MADEIGEADIRGLDIDKLVKGFADEDNIMKKYCKVSKAANTHIRWYKKTAGFIDSTDTTGITKSWGYNMAFGAQPFIVQQTWTQENSYVRKFMYESQLITIEDIKNCDVDVLATMVRDVVRSVARQVDQRIIAVLTEATEAAPTVPVPSDTNNGGATADGWNDDETGDPITDIMEMERAIRAYSYNPKGAVLIMNEAEYKWLRRWIITIKGSSVPQFASEQLKASEVSSILGHPIVVSHNYTTDSVAMIIPGVTLTWKNFMGIQSAMIDEAGIGKKVRVWEEGECLLTDPKSCYILTDTIVG